MPFNIARQTVYAGVETTPGTEQTTLAAMDVDIGQAPTLQVAAPERRAAKGGFGLSPGAVPRVQFQTRSFTAPLVGGTGLGLAPTISPLLQACGLAEVLTASTDAVYTPVSSGQKAATIKFNEDGLAYKMIGSMGNLQLNWESGNYPMVTAEMTGFYAEPVAEALSVPDFSSNPLPVLASADSGDNISIFGFADASVRSFSLNMGNRLFSQDMPGGESISITDRTPTGTVVVEAPTLGSKNFFAQLTAGTIGNLNWDIGKVSGQIVQFRATGTAQLIDIAQEDVDGVRFYGLSFRLIPTETLDDDFTITLL